MGRLSALRVRAAWPLLVASTPLACSFFADLDGLSTPEPSGDAHRDDAAALDGPVDGMTTTTACRPKFSGASCETPCPPKKAGPACAFSLVFGLDIPISSDWERPADVPYTDNESGTMSTFSRVAYRFVLDTQEIWVELDPFTSDAMRLGVPVDWIFDQPIRNVTVAAFGTARPNVTVPRDGKMEFWSNCYHEGSDGRYDDDDEFRDDVHCFGSMQIHVAGVPAFCFNRWSDPTAKIDVGIGAAPSGNLDWTFAANGEAFATRRLEVYVR